MGISMLMLNMVKVLAKNPDVELCLLASADELTPDGKVAPEVGLDGIPVIPLPWKRSLREALWLATNFPAIDRYLASDFWVYCSMETFVPARRCKRIVTVHHLEPPIHHRQLTAAHFRGQVRTRRLRKALATADLLVAQSTFTRDAVAREFSIPLERMKVVGSGVTRDLFDVPNNQGLDDLVPDYSPYVLSVGALERRKGTDYVLELAKLLLAKELPIRIVCTAGLYGDPSYISAARALPNIVLLNFVARQELFAYMKKAVCLICLSRLEGFGLPLVEAMAAGLPVIASNNSAIPETLGGAGILVEPGDTPTIAGEIGRLQQDTAHRAELIAKGEARARIFTWEACMQRLLAGIHAVSLIDAGAGLSP
ncbi:MAG: glycosyltransferase family 4 protein [Limisphaerales bacterium]